MRNVFFCLAIASASAIFAQTSIPAANEFTKKDVISNSTFDGTKISVYGLQLGMTKKEAKLKLESNKNVNWEYEAFTTKSKEDNSTAEMRIYVKKKNPAPTDEEITLLYLIWNEGSSGLDRIVFFNPMKEFAIGETKKLFHPDAADLNSEFYKKVMLKADKREDGRYTIIENYISKSLQIIQYKTTVLPFKVYFAVDRNLK